MKTMIVVKGTSGTGKGTRVAQYIEWLRTKLTPREVTIENDGKVRKFGLAFEELGLLFVGQYTVSNKSGLASWTSMDTIHSALNSDGAAQYLKAFSENYTLVCEGEPMMLSNRWRPAYLFETFGLDSLALLYFVYPNRAEYDQRIIGRSGKKAGDSGWGRNANYLSEFDKSIAEFNNIEGADVVSVEIAMCDYDDPVSRVGWSIDHQLVQAGKEALLTDIFGPNSYDSFLKFCDEHPMLRSMDGNNPLAHRAPADKVKPVDVVPAKKSTNLLDMMRGAGK